MKRISDRRREQLKAYTKVRDEFMAAHPTCHHCGKKSQDPHHLRGRIGSLLTDTRYLIALCRKCHDFVGANPAKARELGLLCEYGKWGCTT